MKRDELRKNIKEKLLFEGPSAVGKTFLSMNIAKLYAMNGKRVCYIDPEAGTDKSLEKVWDNLTDEELDKIELVHATNLQTYLNAMLGYTEKKDDGTEITHFKDYDLKILDGLTTELEIYKTELTQKFLSQGFYEIGGSKFNIQNQDTFVLPYQYYNKIYDQIRQALVIVLNHSYDIVATMHPLRETNAQQALQQSIYAKMDSVVRLKKEDMGGFPKWSATIVKNRGREAVDKSNELDSTTPLLMYFIKKFKMDVPETLKRLDIKE